MVANLTVVLLCWFRTGRASLQTSNENRGERKPKPPATVCGKPSRWCGQSVQILLNYVGCEARKLPAGGEVFFLDFSFYRGGLNGWTQHLLAVYSPESESLRSFSGVDLSATLLCPDGTGYSRTGRFSSGSIVVIAHLRFRSSRAAKDFADHRNRLSHPWPR